MTIGEADALLSVVLDRISRGKFADQVYVGKDYSVAEVIADLREIRRLLALARSDAAGVVLAPHQGSDAAAEAQARRACEAAIERVRDGGTVEGKTPGAAWFNACMNSIDAIRALASPDAAGGVPRTSDSPSTPTG